MTTKVCSRCKEEKNYSEFNKNKTKKDGHSYSCKKCHAETNRKHYLNNKKTYFLNSKKGKKLLVEWYNEYKKTLKCSMCSESRHYCLDFHHTDPTDKKYTVSQMIANGSKKNMVREIEKCIVVCRNCHAEIHYLEKQGFDTSTPCQIYLDNI